MILLQIDRDNKEEAPGLYDWAKDSGLTPIDGFFVTDEESAIMLKLTYGEGFREYIKIPEDSDLPIMFGEEYAKVLTDPNLTMEDIERLSLVPIGESHVKIEMPAALDMMLEPGFVLTGEQYFLVPKPTAKRLSEKHKCIQEFNVQNLVGGNTIYVRSMFNYFYWRIASITGKGRRYDYIR